jgi:hypothetical protein
MPRPAGVSDAQVRFFEQLLSEKDFGDVDQEVVRDQFVQLDKRSASAWIERAMALPKATELEGAQLVAPTF